MEQLHYARLGVGGAGSWQLFAEDGDMRMYRREEEADGLVVDPLKACHVVKGVTGHEVCEIFFSPEYRSGWEATLEDMTIVDNISKDTLLFLQTHKRIWPASQRDALFWSHMRHVSDDQDRDAQDLWIVCNHSTEHPDYPVYSACDGEMFLPFVSQDIFLITKWNCHCRQTRVNAWEFTWRFVSYVKRLLILQKMRRKSKGRILHVK